MGESYKMTFWEDFDKKKLFKSIEDNFTRGIYRNNYSQATFTKIDGTRRLHSTGSWQILTTGTSSLTAHVCEQVVNSLQVNVVRGGRELGQVIEEGQVTKIAPIHRGINDLTDLRGHGRAGGQVCDGCQDVCRHRCMEIDYINDT